MLPATEAFFWAERAMKKTVVLRRNSYDEMSQDPVSPGQRDLVY